jgi:hypothetical protein
MVVFNLDNDIKQMFEKVLTKLDSMDGKIDGLEVRMGSLEARQKEIYLLQRGLEESVKVTRAEQDKMMLIVSDIQGKVTKLANEVKDHDMFIKQIRAIK